MIVILAKKFYFVKAISHGLKRNEECIIVRVIRDDCEVGLLFQDQKKLK